MTKRPRKEMVSKARIETDKWLAAMKDEDWRLIEEIVVSLRLRYPGLHIEYGEW